MTPDGVGEVHDFMPVAGEPPTDQHRLVRNTKVVRGTMKFRIDIQPRFDYGRAPHKLDISENGVVFRAGDTHLTVHGIPPPGSAIRDMGLQVEEAPQGLRWTPPLHERQIGRVALDPTSRPPRH